MLVRHATLDDSDNLLSWRNEPAARAAFKNPGKVDRATHIAWLMDALNSPRTVILIGERAGDKIGMVRFDWLNESWSTSIIISPEHRGSGHGYELLRKGLIIFDDMYGPCGIVAEVHVNNHPSLRIFERCAFVTTGIAGSFVQLRRDGKLDSPTKL